MKNFSVIMEWTADGRVAKVADFDTLQEAEAHRSRFMSQYPSSEIVMSPSQQPLHWKKQGQLVTIDIPVKPTPPPSQLDLLEQRIAALEARP